MNEKVSERLKELYKASGNKMVVTTLRGKQHEILLSKDDKYFYSYTALNNGKIELKLSWFDGIVDFIKENDGRVKKGAAETIKSVMASVLMVLLRIMLQKSVLENLMVNHRMIRFLLFLQY